MKNSHKFLSSILLILILFMINAPMAQAKTINAKVSGQINYSESYRFLNKLNSLRKSKGLPAVKMDKSLLAAAEQRAAETSILFAHTRPSAKGCASASPYIKGENIVIANSASAAYTWWKNSPGHYQNMISGRWTSVGICCIVVDNQMYWVNLFGTKPAQTVKKSGKAKKSFSVAVNTSYLKSGNIFFEGPCRMQSEESKTVRMVLFMKSFGSTGTLPAAMFRYETSNPSVCKVSASGIVTTLQEGKSVITATLKSNPSIRKKVTLIVDDSFWSYDDEFDD